MKQHISALSEPELKSQYYVISTLRAQSIIYNFHLDDQKILLIINLYTSLGRRHMQGRLRVRKRYRIQEGERERERVRKSERARETSLEGRGVVVAVPPIFSGCWVDFASPAPCRGGAARDSCPWKVIIGGLPPPLAENLLCHSPGSDSSGSACVCVCALPAVAAPVTLAFVSCKPSSENKRCLFALECIGVGCRSGGAVGTECSHMRMCIRWVTLRWRVFVSRGVTDSNFIKTSSVSAETFDVLCIYKIEILRTLHSTDFFQSYTSARWWIIVLDHLYLGLFLYLGYTFILLCVQHQKHWTSISKIQSLHYIEWNFFLLE